MFFRFNYINYYFNVISDALLTRFLFTISLPISLLSFPSPFTQLTAGKQEMIVVWQHPLLWWCIRRSAESQHVGSALKTRVTYASDPS